jgi:hypothetical protein
MAYSLPKIEWDTEKIVAWAYQEELSKRQTSSAEGIWDRILEDGQRGGIDPGHGAAQRYPHFGLPDPDAIVVENAVACLEDTIIDWPQSFDAIAGDLGALVTVNDMTRQGGKVTRPKAAGWGRAGAKAIKAWWGDKDEQPVEDRPRDVLMVGGLRTAALVTMHAVRGTRPDWVEEHPKPSMVSASRGPNAHVVGDCRGKNLYSIGAYCPLKWSPSPLSIISSRAEYVAWHHGLVELSRMLLLAKFSALPPRASATPWLDRDEQGEPESHLRPVLPTAFNSVSGWGTLPLAPLRGRMGPPLRARKAGPVRYLDKCGNG